MSDKAPKILLVEDDIGLQKQIKWSLDDYEVVMAGDRETALNQVRRHEPAVVLLDLGLPPDPDGATEGLATLQQILQLAPATKIIVVTGNQDRTNAIMAIGQGAFDFYHKPFEEQILKLVIARAFKVHELERENRALSARNRAEPLQGLITNDPEMLKVCRMIEKVAPSDASVLLLGESGTGKEVLARGLHDLSPRAKERFAVINCAAIPENLLESELFGYEKGAFTGAAKQTIGKIEYADKGTLFLDEIGDLPMPLQAKLLRFLQERVIERLGGRGEIPVDVRVVAATHQNLQELIRDGRFREDLFYRLSEITVRIPPPTGAPGRQGPAGPRLSGALQPDPETEPARHHRRCPASHRGPPLARQRAGNGKHPEARRHHGGRRPDHLRGPGPDAGRRRR
jgi:two-component system NtrC family response regulator